MNEPGLQTRRQRIGPGAIRILTRWSLDRIALVALTGLAVAIGVWLRVSLLGSGSLWMDELWTMDAVSRSFKEMVGARLISDQAPPLWLTTSWVWVNLVGTYNATSLRFLSAAFSCLAIAAPIVGAVKMPPLRPTFLVMAALLALSLFTVQYGVEFRTYSMMICLGAVATVIWAGMLTAQLPRSGRWIFGFALVGALSGFGNYYGNILYGMELAVLLAVLAWERQWRPARILFTWGALSLLPVTVWYFVTRNHIATGSPVAPPTISELQTWLMYAFAPVTNRLAGQPLGYEYPDVYGAQIAGLGVVSILAALIWHASTRERRATRLPPATLVGAAAMVVAVAGVSFAWTISLVTEPTMNTRHLAALLPALFLAAGCACTLFPERARWVTGSIAVAVLIAVNGLFVSQYGVGSLTPPWHAQAGYKDTVRILISASHESPAPTLIGLNTAWQWHGQWDAAIRSELGSGPAVSSDPEPLAVHWINSVADIKPNGVPRGPAVLFSDWADQRQTDLFAWAEKTLGPCRQSTYGGPAYGLVTLLRCG